MMSDQNNPSKPPNLFKPEVPRPDTKPPIPEVKPASQVVLPPMNEDPKEKAEAPKEEPKQEEPKPEEPKPILFELRLTETNVQTGSIPITWCVEKEWLLNNSHRELFVLLSVRPPEKGGHRAEWRGWAKLSEMMAYVTFYRAGKNKITGYVTDNKEILKEWMKREEGIWKRNSVIVPDDWEDPDKVKNVWGLTRGFLREEGLGSQIEVDLPIDCFAKEPSDWEKYWVNFFFRNKAIDQCEFRRRRMLAYTVQPIVFLFLTLSWCLLVSAIHLFNLMIGKWTRWKGGFGVSIEIADRVDFLTCKKLGRLWWLFLPVPWLTVASVFLFFVCKHHLKLLFLLAPAYMLLVPIGFLLGLGAAYFANIAINYWLDKIPLIRAARERAEEEERKRLEAIRKAEMEALELLLCSSGKKILRLRDLPKQKRTIKLRFQGAKALVCKPFSR